MNISQRIFVQAFLIMSCVLCVTNLTAGVSNDTTIQTQDGPKLIKILKIGDKILCFNMKDLSVEEREVSAIQEVQAESVVEITTSDNVTFYVTPDQKLFVTHKWVEAKNLTIEDVLMTKDKAFVRVTGIRHLDIPMTLRFITVNEHHNFFAAENGVLIHNGPVTGACAYWGIKVFSYVGICVGTTVAVGAAIGTLPVSGPVIATGGGVATAGLSIVGPMTTGATLIAGGAAGTGTVAGTVVASGLQSTALIASTAAAVESFSFNVGALFLAIPFLP